MEAQKYEIQLNKDYERDLSEMAKRLNITEAEIFNRAMLLMRYASKADYVELVKGNQRTRVNVK